MVGRRLKNLVSHPSHRKSSISTKSNLSTDTKCHFVSMFQKYVKNPVKQKGLLFPPSVPYLTFKRTDKKIRRVTEVVSQLRLKKFRS